MGYYISVQSLPRNFTAKMMMIIVLLALTDFEQNPQKPKSEKKKTFYRQSNLLWTRVKKYYQIGHF